MTMPEWKTIDSSLPKIGEIVAICISGIPEFVAYKRIQAGLEDITYEQVSDPEYVDIFSIAEPLERLNKFANKHGWVWAEVDSEMLMMDFSPSHWASWFEPPNA